MEMNIELYRQNGTRKEKEKEKKKKKKKKEVG